MGSFAVGQEITFAIFVLLAAIGIGYKCRENKNSKSIKITKFDDFEFVDAGEFCFDANFDVPFVCEYIDLPFPFNVWPREIKILSEK